MSRVSKKTIVDVTYEDPRSGQRFRERRVQEVPWDEVDNVRERELALVQVPQPEPPAAPRDDRYRKDDRLHVQDRRYDRPRSVYTEDRRYRRSDDYYDRRATRDYDSYDSDSSQERRRRRRRRREERSRDDRRARSERGAPEQEQGANDKGPKEYLWYSMKERREGNFFERNFDSSYDGLIAAAAGAAIGAMAVRNFATNQYEKDAIHDEQQEEQYERKMQHEKGKKWLKIGAGAVAGAAAFNAGENWFRLYTEEKEEREEEAPDLKTPAKLANALAQKM